MDVKYFVKTCNNKNEIEDKLNALSESDIIELRAELKRKMGGSGDLVNLMVFEGTFFVAFLTLLATAQSNYFIVQNKILQGAGVGFLIFIITIIGGIISANRKSNLAGACSYLSDYYEKRKMVLSNGKERNDAFTGSRCEDNASRKEQDKTIDINNTCILDYLEIVKQEYQIERGKRQSFETRANIVITILAALFVFVFEKIKVSDIIALMNSTSCSFFQLFKILSGIGVYTGFVLALTSVLKSISVRQCKNLDVEKINETKIGAVRLIGLSKLIASYREIILWHREVNKEIAKALQLSISYMVYTMLAIVFYINM